MRVQQPLALNQRHLLRPAAAAPEAPEKEAWDVFDRIGVPGHRPEAHRLWTEIDQAGVLGATGLVPGAIGAVLSSSTKAALKEIVHEIAGKGVKFTTHGDRELSVRKVMGKIEEAHRDIYGLFAQAPGEERNFGVSQLSKLLALHEAVVHPEALGEQFPQTLRRLQSQRHNSSVDEGLVQSQVEILGGGYLHAGAFEQYADPSYIEARHLNDLNAISYFQTSNALALDALPDQPEAQKYKELANRELMGAWSAMAAYRERPAELKLGPNGGGPKLVVPGDWVDQPERAEKFYRQFEASLKRHVLPVFAAGRISSSEVPEPLCQLSGKFGLEPRLAVYGAIVKALVEGEHSGWQAEPAFEVYQGLEKQCSSSYELATKLKAIEPVLLSGGSEAALKSLEQLSRMVKSPDPAESSAFEKLLAATGSLDSAATGLTSVRIPLAEETLEERAEAFAGLAEQLDPELRHLTPDLYNELLVLRDRTRPFVESAVRFRKVLGGCAALKQTGLAPAVFKLVQEQVTRDGPEAVEAAIAEFHKQSLLSNDLMQALQPIQQVTGDEISFEEDWITVGDFSLPVG